MTNNFDQEYYEHQLARKNNWDEVARNDYASGEYYREYLARVYAQIVPAGSSVLELGCGKGDLLASLKPSIGVGVDFSGEYHKIATARHPQLQFMLGDMHEIDLGDRTFDFIILSDVINDIWDVQLVLEKIRRYCRPDTRLVFNYFSQVWKPALSLARRLKLAKPMLLQNWLTNHDVENLLEISGYQTLRRWGEIVWPLRSFGVERFLNRCMAKIPPSRYFILTNILVARPAFVPAITAKDISVSVIVPARNEAGHIDDLIKRIPEMGAGTEIIFVEGNSTDDTYETIRRAIDDNKQRKCILLKQQGRGKGDAVRAGFDAARGDILMILDADITVPPEDLPRFFDILVSGSGEFVNGVRLVYPMQDDAMRFANLIGNKLFSIAFSWVLGQKIRDTLCGTKVLWAKDYQRIANNRAYFGDFDPFGDFDLLFGAAKLSLKIVEVPVRYRTRRYGETNIQRWVHGWLLLRMVMFAARRIKFF